MWRSRCAKNWMTCGLQKSFWSRTNVRHSIYVTYTFIASSLHFPRTLAIANMGFITRIACSLTPGRALAVKQVADWKGAYKANALRTLLIKASRVNGF